MRLGAVLSGLHVAVESSKIWRVDANALFSNLGGATGPVYLFYTAHRLLSFHVDPTQAASFLEVASFEALRERKGASNA